MTTLQLQLPDDMLRQIQQVSKNGNTNDLIIEALSRFLKNRERQKLNAALKEGYQANFEENLAMAAEFDVAVADGLID